MTSPPPPEEYQIGRRVYAEVPDVRRAAVGLEPEYCFESLEARAVGADALPHEQMFHRRRVIVPTRVAYMRGRRARAVMVDTYRKSLRAWGLHVRDEVHRGNATVAVVTSGSLLDTGAVGGWLEVVERFGETFISLYLQERPDPPDNQLERSFGGNPPQFAVWARLSDAPSRHLPDHTCFGWLYLEQGMASGPSPVSACEAFVPPPPGTRSQPRGMDRVCLHPGQGLEGAVWRTARSPWAVLVPYWTMAPWHADVVQSIAATDYTGDMACALLRLGFVRIRDQRLWVQTTWCAPGSDAYAVVSRLIDGAKDAPLRRQDIVFDDSHEPGSAHMQFRLCGEDMCGVVIVTPTKSRRTAWATWHVWRQRDERLYEQTEGDVDDEDDVDGAAALGVQA